VRRRVTVTAAAPFLAGHTDSVYAVATAPDVTWLATAGDDRTIRVWGTVSTECFALMRAEAGLLCCAWLPRGDELVVGGKVGFHHVDVRPPGSGVAGLR